MRSIADRGEGLYLTNVTLSSAASPPERGAAAGNSNPATPMPAAAADAEAGQNSGAGRAAGVQVSRVALSADGAHLSHFCVSVHDCSFVFCMLIAPRSVKCLLMIETVCS